MSVRGIRKRESVCVCVVSDSTRCNFDGLQLPLPGGSLYETEFTEKTLLGSLPMN